MEAEYKVSWHHKPKTVTGRKLSPNLLHAISSHAMKSKHASDYEIKGCTEIRLRSHGGSVIYRCTEEYRGYEWYDFALIEDPAGSTSG